jgi:Ferritin-like domain
MDGSCGRSDPVLSDTPETRSSRGRLLGTGAVGATAIAGFSLLGPRAVTANAAPSQAQDQKIFNFALLLEYLQAAFYGEAVDHGRLKGEVREFAEIVSGHERAHVDFLRKALGARARDRPAFEFGDATKNERKFVDTAVLLENTGVVAYNGQAANLTKKALAAAAQIVSVEGRHAAWVSDLAGKDPAPRAADVGASAAAVASTLRQTGFLKGS